MKFVRINFMDDIIKLVLKKRLIIFSSDSA